MDDFEKDLQRILKDSARTPVPAKLYEALESITGDSVRSRSVLRFLPLGIGVTGIALALVTLQSVGALRPDAGSNGASSPAAASATLGSARQAVYSVSELLDARSTGKIRGETVALHGFWTNRLVPHGCAPPDSTPGALEIWCHDGEWGITERPEPIAVLVADSELHPAAGPHLTPYVPKELTEPLFGLPLLDGQPFPPIPIELLGHFDDPAVKDCRPGAQSACADRFVLEKIVAFDVTGVPPPLATVSPTDFPFAYPPAAPFDVAECAGTGPYSFTGWTESSDLNLDEALPPVVYAAVTRDVVVIGGWTEDPEGSGQRFRTWGQRVCYAREGEAGSFTLSWVPGSAYREWEDGRRTPIEP